MSAINEGIDIRILGESFRHVENSMFMMTLPGSGIDGIEDLAGHKIGDSLHISHVKLPAGVTPVITERDFTIATIVAPAGGVSEAETEEA